MIVAPAPGQKQTWRHFPQVLPPQPVHWPDQPLFQRRRPNVGETVLTTDRASPSARSRRGGEFEANHASNDQPKADEAAGVGCVAQQHHAEDGSAYGADANPNRVGGTDR